MKNWYFRAFVLATLYAIDSAYQYNVVGVVGFPDCYLAAVLTGGITVALLHVLFRQSTLLRRVMRLQVIWAGVHMIGLIMWLWYAPPDLYDGAQSVLHAVQVALFLWTPGDDQNNFTNNFRRFGFGLRHFRVLRNNHEGQSR